MSNESRGSEERGENCAHELGFQRAAKPKDYPGADDMMMVRMVMVMVNYHNGGGEAIDGDFCASKMLGRVSTANLCRSKR